MFKKLFFVIIFIILTLGLFKFVSQNTSTIEDTQIEEKTEMEDIIPAKVFTEKPAETFTAQKNIEIQAKTEPKKTETPTKTPPISNPLTAKKEYRAGDYDFSLTHDELKRIYRVYVPQNYKNSTPTAMVIYLHGGGGNINSAEQDGLNKMSDKHGFILVAPEGTGEIKLGQLRGHWNGGVWGEEKCCGTADDVGFISKMIDEIKNNFNIDEKKIFATGISNGGLMTNRLGCELSDKISAIAPVAAPAVESNCNSIKPISVMIIHGMADPAFPPDGSASRGIFKQGGSSDFAVPYKNMATYQIATAWEKTNQCSDKIINDYQNGDASCTYHECSQSSVVELCLVENMGHTYPSGYQYLPKFLVGPVSFDISFDQIWEFYKLHPMK
jgi:polyhydroxybutyrate depolymerase